MAKQLSKKPWGLGKGWLIAAVLMAVGLLLHLALGPVQWQQFAWPVNGVALLVLLLVVAVVFVLGSRVRFCSFLGTYGAAVPALVVATALTVVMGLTRQQTGGSWLSDMLRFWPFVLSYTYIALILGLVVLKRLLRRPAWRNVPFLLNHVGLFMALVTATLGNADVQQLQMWTTNNADMANRLVGEEQFHQYERTAYDEHNQPHQLPIAIELKRFIIEKYADSTTVRRYASEVMIYSQATMHQYAATIDVNKPVEVDGWKIYQKDYRLTDAGDDCQISILELVRDPWLPWVYAGIIMMLLGALLQLFIGRKKQVTPSP